VEEHNGFIISAQLNKALKNANKKAHTFQSRGADKSAALFSPKQC